MANYKPATEGDKRQLSDALGPEGSYYDAVAREVKPEPQPENSSDWPKGLYPIFIVVLYMVLGIAFRRWHPGWLIFLTIPLYYMHPHNTLLKLGNPVMILLIYLVMGIFFHLWHPGWLIFFAIPAVYIINGHERREKKQAEREQERPNVEK